MLMRYHWSLAVGHTYSHEAPHEAMHQSRPDESTSLASRDASDVFALDVQDPDVEVPAVVEEPEDAEDLEFCLEDREDDLHGESDYDSHEEDREDPDGEVLEAMGVFGPMDGFSD